MWGGRGAVHLLKWIFNPPGIKYLKTAWIIIHGYWQEWFAIKWLQKTTPEDKTHTLYNHHSKAFSEPQLSWERRMSLVKRNRTKFGPAAPWSSLLLKLKHRVHSKTKAKTENQRKGSCPPVLNPHTKGPVAPDSLCPLHMNAGWEAITHSRPGRYKYTCFPFFPSQPQTFPQANNEGARTAADAQCATPQGDLSLPAL